jgi:hypothetical protein
MIARRNACPLAKTPAGKSCPKRPADADFALSSCHFAEIFFSPLGSSAPPEWLAALLRQ